MHRDTGLARQLGSWLAWQHAAGVVDLVADPADLPLRRELQAAPVKAAEVPFQPSKLQPVTLSRTSNVDRAPRLPILETPRRLEAGDVATAREMARACSDLASLEDAISRFDGCALKKTATRLCFADGNPASRLVLIGEAPGAEEDRRGKPFVGASGQLLDRMLATIGLDRTKFWITNCLFWRPPGNRTPSPQEILVCQPFLERALELVQPEVILFVGGTAARTLLGLEEGVTRLRGTFRSWQPDWSDRPVSTLVTFHPAYLLRNPAQKRLVWRDLLQLHNRLTTVAAPQRPEMGSY